MPDPIQILVGPGAFAFVGDGGPLLISREHIRNMIDFLVALEDIAEPEADLEATGAEDDFMTHAADGAGCNLSDAGGPSWPERHRLSRHGGFNGSLPHEDAEDDDPAEDDDVGEDDDPDDLNGDEGDYSHGDFGFCRHYGLDQSQPISSENPEVR